MLQEPKGDSTFLRSHSPVTSSSSMPGKWPLFIQTSVLFLWYSRSPLVITCSFTPECLHFRILYRLFIPHTDFNLCPSFLASTSAIHWDSSEDLLGLSLTLWNNNNKKTTTRVHKNPYTKHSAGPYKHLLWLLVVSKERSYQVTLLHVFVSFHNVSFIGWSLLR